ncbi:hypothetical protein AOLI_G00106140 [Acnodon oligacanthus]
MGYTLSERNISTEKTPSVLVLVQPPTGQRGRATANLTGCLEPRDLQLQPRTLRVSSQRARARARCSATAPGALLHRLRLRSRGESGGEPRCRKESRGGVPPAARVVE